MHDIQDAMATILDNTSLISFCFAGSVGPTSRLVLYFHRLDGWLGEEVKLLLVVAFLAVVFLAIFGTLLVRSSSTGLSVRPPVKTVGIGTPVAVLLTNARGERVDAYIEQNNERYPVYGESRPSTWILWSRREPPRSVTFEAGKSRAPNLKDGKARLVVEAVSNDLRASSTVSATDVDVVLEPPRVVPDGLQHYINQGGMELVTMTAGGSFNDAGVKVGAYTFRSFPLPGKDANQRFAMFAYPWDLPPDVEPRVYARNLAGAETTAHFWFKLFPKKFRVRDFELTDALLAKLVKSSRSQRPGPARPGPCLPVPLYQWHGAPPE